MPFLLVHEAVGLALLGVDPTVPLAAKQDADISGHKRGLVSPAFDGLRDEPTKPTKIGDRAYASTGSIKRLIPVYHVAPRGHQAAETWPCISYELVGIEFNPERYIWRADTFRTSVGSSRKTVTVNGKQVIGPALLSVRDNPTPYDLVFQVDLWAKQLNDSLLLNKVLLETFEARGALKAVQQSGEPYTWEMYLRDAGNRSDPEPTLEDQLKRGYHWTYTYVVESFLDNTMVTRLRQTVTSFNLDLEVR